MKHSRRVALLIVFIATIFIVQGSLAGARPAVFISPTELQIGVGLNKQKISGGETVNGRVDVRRNGNTQELVFRLEASNSSLVRFSTNEIRLKPDESSASFEISTAPTLIKVSVSIKALLQPADQLQAQRTLEIVPALLKGVTLLQPTLHGTHGARIGVRAELNANAPTGGIELYLDIFVNAMPSKTLRRESPNPRIPAGTRDISFDIDYDRIYISDNSIGTDQTTFNEDTRTVDLVVSLEAQSARPWAVIPGISKKVSFDVIPLRVASISVQPAAVTGGAESLASFALNIPPGNNETLRLSPVSKDVPQKAWARLLGTSCQTIPQEIRLPLTAGVTNYSFKVCTAAVTTARTSTLDVLARSGTFPVQITIQP